MKAIMKNIKSKTCANIMNLIQSILVIKNKNEATTIQKLIDENGYADIYGYCSKDRKNYLYWDWYDPPYVEEEWFVSTNPKIWSDDRKNINGSFNGKVVFKFRCYKVEEIIDDKAIGVPYFTTQSLLEKDLCKKSCLTPYDFNDYLKGKTGYAIHISDLEIFDKPKELDEFYNLPKKLNTTYDSEMVSINLTKEPRNFCYVEVD